MWKTPGNGVSFPQKLLKSVVHAWLAWLRV